MKILNLAFVLLIGSFAAVSQQETSVLFIGNSFTFMNGMPSMFKQIALAKGKRIIVDSIVQGGQDFNFHASRPETYSKIKERKWDYVIIQGHSNELAQPNSKVDTQSLPYAKMLVDSAKANNSCTQVILYMTWGYKNGNAKWKPISTYDSMQYRITNQYLRFADLLDTKVSPVGEVWRDVRTNYPAINLYYTDLYHPNELGSYLSACTHFTTIFGESPIKNNAPILIDDASRQIIEFAASGVVLNNLGKWRNVTRTAQMETGFDIILQDDFVMLENRSKNATWVDWDFGDGSKSTVNNPSHCYSEKGTYTLTQTIKNACKVMKLERQINVQ